MFRRAASGGTLRGTRSAHGNAVPCGQMVQPADEARLASEFSACRIALEQTRRGEAACPLEEVSMSVGSEVAPGGSMHAVSARTAFDGERFMPGGATVIVANGVIQGVESADYQLPSDCPSTSFDGTVLPGLFDAHVHLVSDASPGSLERAGSLSGGEVDKIVEKSLRQHAASGVTTVRDLGDVGYRTIAFRDAERVDLPRIQAVGPPVTVPDGHCFYLGGVVDGSDAIRAAVAERKERGVDAIKVMASGGITTIGSDPFGVQFDAADLRTLVTTAHTVGLPVLAHAHSLAGIRHALAAGVDGIEHFTGLTEVGIDVPDEVLLSVAEAGVWVNPTLGVDRTVMASMPTPPPGIGIVAAMERIGLDLASAQAARLEVLARAHTFGVRLVTGVDAGAAPPKPHGIVALALADLTDGGFSVADAVATSTSGAAQACGLSHVTGRLEAGLAADLLVVDGELERDITSLQRPVAVLIRGEPLSPPQKPMP